MASYLLLTREVAQRHLAVVGFYCLSVATAVTAGTPPENPRRALDIENALRADTKLFHGFLPIKAGTGLRGRFRAYLGAIGKSRLTRK
jgi:hypothetical protein